MKTLFACLYFLLAHFAQAQKGCTDPQATNFNPSANTNDGSCVYPNTLISPNILVQKLSDTLNETSALALHRNHWYSLNDGGNPASIYRITKNGKIDQIIHVRNQANTDWEELAFSDSFGFIGNFGNNSGNRKDLNILKFSTAQWPLNNQLDSINANEIQFAYADQTNFTATTKATPFDCEALIFWGDSLHVFTKNWSTGFTKRYVIPKTPGNYLVAPRDSLYLNFLVTGATVFKDRIALVGYDKSGNGFLQLLWDFPAKQPFNGNKRRINLGSFISVGQIESISFKDSVTLLATNEKYIVANRLMEIPLLEIWNKTAQNKTPKHEIHLVVSPNPTKGQLNIQWLQPKSRMVAVTLMSLSKPNTLILNKQIACAAGPKSIQIDLEEPLLPGSYLLKLDGIEKGLTLQEKIIYQP